MSAKSHSSQFLKLVNSVMPEINEITPQELSTKLHQTKSCYLIDVREESEWATGHLPTAIHLSKGIIERDIEKMIPDPQAEIILYCGGGFRSALAATNIQRMGYQQVKSLRDGVRGWSQAGFPLVND